MRFLTLFGFILVFGLTSCIEIIDDITIKNDGSGMLKYTVNLSSSKLKINSILALDSLEGKKVPSKDEISQRIYAFGKKLEEKNGVSNVSISTDFNDFIFKMSCEFTSLSALQNAIKEVVQEETKEKSSSELDHNWMSWDGQKLIRSIPDITIKKTKELKADEIESLKQGSYTSITRFERMVEKCENPNAQISKNKMAVMMRTNPYALTQNYNLLENTIYLSPLKN